MWLGFLLLSISGSLNYNGGRGYFLIHTMHSPFFLLIPSHFNKENTCTVYLYKLYAITSRKFEKQIGDKNENILI